MDRYRSMYKKNSSTISPRQLIRINRDLHNADRAKQRKQTFQSGRNFDVSPTPQKGRVPLPQSCQRSTSENKENHVEITLGTLDSVNPLDAPSTNKSRIAKAVSASKKFEKLSRKDAYLKRFIEFKAQKQRETRMKLDSKKRPFVPIGISSASSKSLNPPKLRGKESSFVPHGHIKFHPPEGLKNPLLESSFYTAVPTPPRKNIKVQPPSKLVNIMPLSWKTPVLQRSKKPVATALPNTNAANKQSENKLPTPFAKPLASSPSKPPSHKVACIVKPVKGRINRVSAKSGATAIGAVGKAYNLQSKRGGDSSQKNAKLSIKMKPQKPANKPTSSAAVISAIKETVTSSKALSNSKTVFGGTEIDAITALPIAKTPTDIVNLNHFEPFVTSTKMKSLSSHSKPLTKSPVNNVQCSLKLTVTARTQNSASSIKPSLLHTKDQGKTRNFNFIRYSVGETEQNLSGVQQQEESVDNTLAKNNERQDEAQESKTTLQESSYTAVLSPPRKNIKVQQSLKLANIMPLSWKTPVLQRSKKPVATALPNTNAANKQFEKQRSTPFAKPLAPPSSKPPSHKVACVVKPVKGSINRVSAKSEATAIGAVGKAYHLQNKRGPDSLRSYSHKNAKLSIKMKPQKSASNKSTNSTAVASAIKATVISSKTVTSSKLGFGGVERDVDISPTAKTPTDIINLNHTRNFNFIRYSVGDAEQNLSGVQQEEENEKQDEAQEFATTVQETVVEQKQQSQRENISETLLNTNRDAKILETPPSSKIKVCTERPTNYLSPYVSVSRGKVSAKKEREKRNSIYLQSTSPISELRANVDKPINTSNNVEIRRTFEAIRYFRLQLASEIDRLHSLCAQWDKYKMEQMSHLQKTGGEDMINVTIGQTKLLTSKKFQQFSGLIDRCEACTLSISTGEALKDDGTENTKLITAIDLEGFWSMLNLQVDNVDKRFDNLELWKANNWVDPEEVHTKSKPKVKSNLHKVKTSKSAPKTAKASSGLQEMLRKMHVEMRKNKAVTAAATTASISKEAISTPTRQRRSRSGTSQYASVVVRDRKSLSVAATVVSIPATNAVVAGAVAAQRRNSRPSLTLKTSFDTESPKALNAIKSARKRKEYGSMDMVANSPPPSATILGRKSILKTPGTAKGKPKNVNFSERLRVKKFNFTLCDDQSENEEIVEEMKREQRNEEFHAQEDPDQRTYQLRTRMVKLRPSSEFEIPHK